MLPNLKCRLRLLKMERIKDYLMMEEVFIKNMERLKPQEDRNQVRPHLNILFSFSLLPKNVLGISYPPFDSIRTLPLNGKLILEWELSSIDRAG